MDSPQHSHTMVAVAAVALHPACRHRLTLPCKQPWQRPQLGQQQQRQQWRPKGNAERRPPPPPALPPAAAASSGDALPQPSAAAAGAGGRPGGGFWLAARRWAAAHAAPLSSPAANRKLLALSLGQMLASVASDLHDTYLGLYLREVLQMSNTHVSSLGWARCRGRLLGRESRANRPCLQPPAAADGRPARGAAAAAAAGGRAQRAAGRPANAREVRRAVQSW